VADLVYNKFMQASTFKTIGMIASFILVIGVVSILAGAGVPFTSADRSDINVLLDRPVLMSPGQITLERSSVLEIENRLRIINQQIETLGVDEGSRVVLEELKRETSDLLQSIVNLTVASNNSAGI